MLLIGKKERGLNMPNQEELEKYVDTLVLMTTSIQRLNWNEDHHSIENIDLLSKKIEETLMGRVLLLPPYFYLSEQSEKSKEQIADIVQAYREQGFQYICILTDLDFTVEDEDEGESIENLKVFTIDEFKEQQENLDQFMKRKTQQIVNEIIQMWQNNNSN